MFVTFPFAFLHCSLFRFNVLIISSNLSDCGDTGVGFKHLRISPQNTNEWAASEYGHPVEPHCHGLPIATRFTAFVPECSYMPCHHFASRIAPRHGEEVRTFGPFCITKCGTGSQRRRNCSLPKKVPLSRTFRTVARVYVVCGRRPWEAQVNDTYWSSPPPLFIACEASTRRANLQAQFDELRSSGNEQIYVRFGQCGNEYGQVARWLVAFCMRVRRHGENRHLSIIMSALALFCCSHRRR